MLPPSRVFLRVVSLIFYFNKQKIFSVLCFLCPLKYQKDFNRKEGFEGIREVCFPFLLRVLFQGTREGKGAQDTTLKKTREGGSILLVF